ncbi:unnamed protein product [Caenorhabditis brenneri]
MRWCTIRHLFSISTVILLVRAGLECDPTSNVKKPDPGSPESYLYCNLEGSFSKRKCASGKIFNSETGECDSLMQADDPIDDIFSQPFFQAPDDLCGEGIPLTILSAPVTCNPSISSCPDGYSCQFYERTGSSYCCQNPTPTAKSSTDKINCGEGRVTYIEMATGKPRSCVLANDNSCPAGFGCTLVSGSTTRCCAKDMGCAINSAPQLRGSNPVECSPTDGSSCKNGYVCSKSQYLNKFICCSNPDGEIMGSCPGGETPLENIQCSATKPCPNGFSCNDKKCCPYASVCPAGAPLNNGPMKCSENAPCPEGHSCVSNAGIQYCCPAKEKVCSLPRNGGVQCASTIKASTRYYFDIATATCRSFKFTQCGGNANNFGSLEECEGFCVDTQCPNGQAHRVGAVNANCALAQADTCPNQHFCQLPLFGPSPICCPTPELTCNEMVSAGTPCFGRGLTIQRYYFNPSTQKCQPFHYYGCSGNGNNFETIDQCQNFCLHSADNACDGLVPLKNPNSELQRCSEEDPCPAGYECNDASFCCPTSENACNANMSRGNGCKGSTQRSMWFYDKSKKKCSQFVYNGCGGTANRFTNKIACTESCVQSSAFGLCPRGMNPFTEEGEITPKTCTLNVRATCPDGSSCVKSSTNQPICCKAVTACPNNRIPYNIPGTNSVVACSMERDDCPEDFQCLESTTAPGFHMCCSGPLPSSQRPVRPVPPPPAPKTRRPYEPDSFAELLSNISPCPPQLFSSGQSCTVNQIGDCPKNHICFRDVGFKQGSCCRTTPPKCSQKGYVPVFLDRTQVQVCQVDIDGCPEDSKCMTSSVAKLAICCQKYQPPSLNNRPANRGVNQGSATNNNHNNNKGAMCANGETPFRGLDNKFQECNFVHNTCPSGYQCEFSSTGQAVCCTNNNVIRCPAGSSVFEYGGRPLACPAGSNKCPQGYSCMPSTNPQHHLCCSSGAGMGVSQPQCLRGVAYVNPATNQRQFCSPMRADCPAGYTCFESDQSSQFICCTHGDLSDRFQGYCPPRQIPYISRDGFPPTCHMQLSPCPTTAPYVCIYSPEKQDSYCCAPIDTAVHVVNPDRGFASPAKNIDLLETPEVPTSNVPGMTQTFAGGPPAPGMGPVAMPDPIPGVDNTRILPPALAQAEMEKKIREQFANTNNGNGNNFGNFDNSENSNNNNGNFGNFGNFGNNNNNFNLGNGAVPGFNNQASQSGCPLGSRPLIGFNQQITECSQQPCPDGFSCVFAEKDNRFQCCSSVSIMLAVNKPVNKQVTPSSNGQIECPPGFFNMDGKCIKILFAGQKGCIADEQCSAREANSTCDNGYCICPTDKPLVHGGKCIANCPEGFSNIAGRCYDPTTVIFMDSVDERKNGTIGGYCLETLIEEKRCMVENSYCSEKTITCTCQLGYDLEMNFEDKDDKGKCKKNSDSKYHDFKATTATPFDDELYFIDISSMNHESPLNDTGVESEDLNKYLFQSDEMIPVFA